MIYHWRLTFAGFHVEKGAAAVGGPQTPAFPAGVGIVNATIQPLGIEAQRIGNSQTYKFTIIEGQQGAALVAGVDRCIGAQAQTVELVYPSIVTAFRAAGTLDIAELWQRFTVEGPTLGAMLPARSGPIQRSAAQTAIETGEMPTGHRRPHHTVAVDIHAAGRKAFQRFALGIQGRF